MKKIQDGCDLKMGKDAFTGVLRDLMVPGVDWMGLEELLVIDLYPGVNYFRDDINIEWMASNFDHSEVSELGLKDVY